MWPFSIFTKRRYEQRYRAALTVFTGAHVFARLSSEEKTRVEAEVNNQCWGALVAPAEHRRWADWSARAALRALAMNRLGVPLPVRGLQWAMMLPPVQTRSFFFGSGTYDPRLWNVVMRFREMDQATNHAKAFLRQLGVDVPDEHPREQGNLLPLCGHDSFLEESGLGKYWEDKRKAASNSSSSGRDVSGPAADSRHST